MRAGAILAVASVDRSVAFYRDVLGFEVEATYDDPPYATLAQLKLVPVPAGTRGYDDLRRHASSRSATASAPRSPRPATSPACSAPLAAREDQAKLLRLRRLTELARERGLALEL